MIVCHQRNFSIHNKNNTTTTAVVFQSSIVGEIRTVVSEFKKRSIMSKFPFVSHPIFWNHVVWCLLETAGLLFLLVVDYERIHKFVDNKH